MESAESHQPGYVNSASFICCCRKRFIQCCTILDSVPITQLGSSSSLSWPWSANCLASYLPSPFSPWPEHPWLLRLPLMVCNMSPSVVSGFMVVNPTFWVFLISSSSCLMAASVSLTDVLATAVSLSTHPQSVSPILYCFRTVFHVISPLQVSSWITSRTILQGLWRCVSPSHFFVHSPHDVIVSSDLPICWICYIVVVKGSFSEHWPLYFILTMLIDNMLDVARYGRHGGELHLLCQHWYT